jgi:hypothetical protein
VIETINAYFVPIYIATEDYARDTGKASKEERAARSQMLKDAWREESKDIFMTSDATCFIVDSQSGTCISAIRLPALMDTTKVLEMLNAAQKRLQIAKGPPVFTPSPQVRPDRRIEADELGLHLVSRPIPSGGTWKQLPAEDFVILSRDEWPKLLPPADAKVGDTYEFDKDINFKILSNFYPPSPNRDPETNRIDSPPLKATVVAIQDGVVRLRLDNKLRMKHHFLPVKDDDLFVDATVVGVMEVDPKSRTIKKLSMVTEEATYADGRFGTAARTIVAPKPTTVSSGAIPVSKFSSGNLLPLVAFVCVLAGCFYILRQESKLTPRLEQR